MPAPADSGLAALAYAPPLAIAIGAALLGALTLYALLGGADFGGGVWDLLAHGPAAEAEHALIAHAMGPVWEANHVWLIVAAVLLFACFPPAFAAIGTVLHVPLAILLVGIVLRGSAFTFRSYGVARDPARAAWGRVFAVASLVSPVMLGAVIGAVASGRIRSGADGRAMAPEFMASWLAPFPLVLGLLTLALFAMLAAVYLTLETADPERRAAFRRRAAASEVLVLLLGAVSLWLARSGAPRLFLGLTGTLAGKACVALAALAAAGMLVALRADRCRAARVLAAAQVALVVWGWGVAQLPYVVVPDLTLANAAAPPAVLRAVGWALVAGAIVLFPSLGYLLAVFKRRPPGPAGAAPSA